MDKCLYNKIENILKKCNLEYNTNYSVINIDNTLHILDNTEILMKICDDFKIVSDKRLIDYVGFEYLKDIVKLLNSYTSKFMKINRYINCVNYTIYNETNLENTYIASIEDYKIVIRRKIENKKLFYFDVVNIEINNIINFIDLNREDSILFETIRLILEGNNIIYKEYMRDDNRILFDLIIYDTEEFKKSKYVNFIDKNSLLLKDFISFQDNVLNIQDNYILSFENKFIIEIKDLDKFKQIIKNINDEYTKFEKVKNILLKNCYSKKYKDITISEDTNFIFINTTTVSFHYLKDDGVLFAKNYEDYRVIDYENLCEDMKLIEDELNKLYEKNKQS